MKRIVFTLLLISTSNAYAGLQPFEDIPGKDNPTMLDEPFSPNYWQIQGANIDDNLSEHENVMNILKVMGGGTPFHYDHHTFVCYVNKSQYFYFYESGWGPGYALTNGAIPGIEDCDKTTMPFTLGSGIKIGMQKNELESILGVSESGNVYDIRHEEIINFKRGTEVCPTWHSVTLNIVMKNNVVNAVYFDEHSEPYDDCKPI